VTLAAAAWATDVDDPADKLVLLALAELRDRGEPTCRRRVAAMTGLTVDQVDGSTGRLGERGLIGWPTRPPLTLVPDSAG
jgi:hypothetical protein